MHYCIIGAAKFSIVDPLLRRRARGLEKIGLNANGSQMRMRRIPRGTGPDLYKHTVPCQTGSARRKLLILLAFFGARAERDRQAPPSTVHNFVIKSSLPARLSL